MLTPYKAFTLLFHLAPWKFFIFQNDVRYLTINTLKMVDNTEHTYITVCVHFGYYVGIHSDHLFICYSVNLH